LGWWQQSEQIGIDPFAYAFQFATSDVAFHSLRWRIFLAIRLVWVGIKATGVPQTATAFKQKPPGCITVCCRGTEATDTATGFFRISNRNQKGRAPGDDDLTARKKTLKLLRVYP
jgi:hypothetical protein